MRNLTPTLNLVCLAYIIWFKTLKALTGTTGIIIGGIFFTICMTLNGVEIYRSVKSYIAERKALRQNARQLKEHQAT